MENSNHQEDVKKIEALMSEQKLHDDNKNDELPGCSSMLEQKEMMKESPPELIEGSSNFHVERKTCCTPSIDESVNRKNVPQCSRDFRCNKLACLSLSPEGEQKHENANYSETSDSRKSILRQAFRRSTQIKENPPFECCKKCSECPDSCQNRGSCSFGEDEEQTYHPAGPSQCFGLKMNKTRHDLSRDAALNYMQAPETCARVTDQKRPNSIGLMHPDRGFVDEVPHPNLPLRTPIQNCYQRKLLERGNTVLNEIPGGGMGTFLRHQRGGDSQTSMSRTPAHQTLKCCIGPEASNMVGCRSQREECFCQQSTGFHHNHSRTPDLSQLNYIFQLMNQGYPRDRIHWSFDNCCKCKQSNFSCGCTNELVRAVRQNSHTSKMFTCSSLLNGNQICNDRVQDIFSLLGTINPCSCQCDCSNFNHS